MIEKRYYLYIAGAGCIFGSVSIFSALLRDSHVSSFQQSVFRVFFALILLFPLVLKKGIFITKKDLRFLAIFGFIMALLGFSENTAIAIRTPVAVTVLLMYTQPAWTAIISRSFLGETLSPKKGAAIVLSILGIALIAEFWKVHLSNFVGPAIALFAGFLLSCEFVFTKISRQRTLHYIQSMFYSYFFRLVFTILFGVLLSFLVSDNIVVGFSLSQKTSVWLLLFLYAFLPMFLGMMVLFFSIKDVSATSAGIILLLEPVSAVFYSYILLGEPIRITTILGGILILSSSFLAIGE